MKNSPLPNNRPKSLVVLAFFIVLALVVFKFFSQSETSISAVNQKQPKRVGAISRTAESSTESTRNPATQTTDADLPIERFVAKESLKVGRADPNPEQTFSRLKLLATRLKKDDVDLLKKMAVNTQFNNDQRFLSVYLLSLSNNPQVTPALLGIALEPVAMQDQTSSYFAEELMIRTQALEGITQTDRAGAPRYLQTYLARQNNSFLADQARRLLRRL